MENKPLVLCNACDRKNERPVNSKCTYVAYAVNKCKLRGVDVKKFVDFLPEVGNLADSALLDGDVTSHRTDSPGNISTLIQETEDCKQQFLDTQRQLGVLIHQMSDLTLAVSNMAREKWSILLRHRYRLLQVHKGLLCPKCRLPRLLLLLP